MQLLAFMQVLGALSQDGIMRFINTDTCFLLFDVGAVGRRLSNVGISPNGRYLAGVLDDGNIGVFSLQALCADINKVITSWRHLPARSPACPNTSLPHTCLPAHLPARSPACPLTCLPAHLPSRSPACPLTCCFLSSLQMYSCQCDADTHTLKLVCVWSVAVYQPVALAALYCPNIVADFCSCNATIPTDFITPSARHILSRCLLVYGMCSQQRHNAIRHCFLHAFFSNATSVVFL